MTTRKSLDRIRRAVLRPKLVSLIVISYLINEAINEFHSERLQLSLEIPTESGGDVESCGDWRRREEKSWLNGRIPPRLQGKGFLHVEWPMNIILFDHISKGRGDGFTLKKNIFGSCLVLCTRTSLCMIPMEDIACRHCSQVYDYKALLLHEKLPPTRPAL